MEDSFLIEQVKFGNREAYRLLVIRYQKPLFKFLATFNFRQGKVEDLAQEAFIRGYRNIEKFDLNRGTFSTWLFSIAKNLAINEKQKKSNQLEILDERKLDLEASKELSPVESAERTERNQLLRKAVDALPAVFRNAVVLSFFKELSLAEIAQIEQCSEGTVKSRIFRGKTMLKHKLTLDERFYDE